MITYEYRNITVEIKPHCYDKKHQKRATHQIVENNDISDYGIKLIENVIDEMYRNELTNDNNHIYAYSNTMFSQGFTFKYISDEKYLIMTTVLPKRPNHLTHKKNTDKKLFVESIYGEFELENSDYYVDSIHAVENMFDTFGIDSDYIEKNIDKEEYYDYIDVDVEHEFYARIYFVYGDLYDIVSEDGFGLEFIEVE